MKLLSIDGFAFKDLNRNDSLDVYEDWRRSPQKRAADLAAQLSIEEIAGLMLYSSQPHHTPPGPGTLPFPFGEIHRAHPHTTGRASLLCLSLNQISGGQSFHRRCPGESLTLVFAVS